MKIVLVFVRVIAIETATRPPWGRDLIARE
jgi:hypothetical protein